MTAVSHSVCIVQARMTSTRLPGKVLMPLSGRTVLRHVLERCRAIPGIDTVCCATTVNASDDPVATEALRCGVEVYRGSEADVLDRYYQAALDLSAETILRVTSDCPLIDPPLCGRVLALVLDGGAKFACNNLPRTWPHGLDCEAFPMSLLTEAAAKADQPYQREHVTPWMRERSGVRIGTIVGPDQTLAHHRWTLDYPEDMAFFEAVFAALPDEIIDPSMDDVLAVLARNPFIVGINSGRAVTA